MSTSATNSIFNDAKFIESLITDYNSTNDRVIADTQRLLNLLNVIDAYVHGGNHEFPSLPPTKDIINALKTIERRMGQYSQKTVGE